MKNIINQLKKLAKTNERLESHVIEYLLEQGSTEEIESHIQDIVNHGCISGTVPHLIYTSDIYLFFDKFYDEIDELRISFEDSIGQPLEIKGDLKTFLSYFAFEETIYRIATDLDIM